ncbi:MAG: siderophore-interacting protein, partial [Sciscionella sp.]
MTTAQTHHHRRSRRVPTGLWRTTVARTRQITPRLRRITLVADELREFVSSGSDSHVLLYLYPPGCALPEPLTAASARAAFSRIRPQMRSYT